MQLVTFGIDKDKKSYFSIPGVYTAIYTTIFGTIPIRNGTSSHFRPK